MGVQIFCTDCHNSDDNREFGGTGPNGPHGSVNSHILEHNYQFSQAAAPGGLVTNTFPNPDLSLNGPYGMCAKCHDLSNVVANTSFTAAQQPRVSGWLLLFGLPYGARHGFGFPERFGRAPGEF